MQVCELLLSELTCAGIPCMSSWRFISACMYLNGYAVNSWKVSVRNIHVYATYIGLHCTMVAIIMSEHFLIPSVLLQDANCCRYFSTSLHVHINYNISHQQSHSCWTTLWKVSLPCWFEFAVGISSSYSSGFTILSGSSGVATVGPGRA